MTEEIVGTADQAIVQVIRSWWYVFYQFTVIDWIIIACLSAAGFYLAYRGIRRLRNKSYAKTASIQNTGKVQW